MTDIMFYASFTASKVGKTGLTVTVDVHRVTRSSGASSEVVTAAAMAEIGDGMYSYRLASADLTLYDYVAIAKTADTSVDQQHLAALWTNYATGAAVAGDAMTLANDAVSAAAIATGAIDADALSTDAVTEISAGNWSYQSSMMTVAGSIGKWIIDHLDALISSRAAAGDQMNLVDAPNATAITAIQAGLAAAGDEMDLVDAPNTTALTAISTSNWTFAGAAGRTLTSLGTLLNSIPQAIWEYARRTLTQTAAQVAAAVAGPELAVTRFCTFENEFEDLTIPATWQVMWLTAKRSKKDRDANAQFMVRVTNGGAASDGGQYYNKTAATSTTMAYASLTVDQPGGSVALLIMDEGTALLADGSYHYDIKYLETDGSIHQLAGEADFEIDSSYTQAVA
jgi:hypothetical protein